MGFDERFRQDHCYLEETTAHEVGMNVEVIDDTLCIEFSETRCISDGNPDTSSTQKCMGVHLQIETNSNENNICSRKDAPQSTYLPSIDCCTHNSKLFLLEDDNLVKAGDKFESHNNFIQYLNENAKRWLFYYKCSDSRKPNTENETYTYNCVYLRNKEKYKKKGIRQRNNNLKTDCPCKIKLRHLPNEKQLTAVYVCNHHDHQLSEEEFHKLQHGRRLPPHIKEEIMDFLALQVDVGKIRKYVLMETGFNMSRPFFHAIERNMKSKYVERQISDERLKELSGKISVVDEMYICDDGAVDDKVTQPLQNKESLYREFGHELTIKNIFTEKYRKRTLRKCSRASGKTEETNKRSKPDTCPQNSNLGTEIMQKSRNLQEFTKCDIQQNPWIIDKSIPVLPNRTKYVAQNDVNIVDENNETPVSESLNSSSDDIVDNSEFHDHDVNDGSDLANNYIVYESPGEVEYVSEDQHNGENDDQNMTEDFDNTQPCEENETVYDQIPGGGNKYDNVPVSNENIAYSETIVMCEGEELEYLSESNDSTDNKKACDAAVQTCAVSKPGHSYVPVFDVYMKDGNVTGFIINNMNKGGVEKGVQTNKEIMEGSNTQTSEEVDENVSMETEPNVIEEVKINRKSGDTYTKHEYIHKYNIDQYMVQPHFPKYIETLAKETSTNVLHMFTNVYNEKAMFKMTTTQRGKEGNTRIWYITDPKRPRKIKRFTNDDKINRRKSGKHLKDIFVLREKVRSLKKRNCELATRNSYLEDVALQLVKDGVVRFETI